MYAGVVHTILDREAWARITQGLDLSALPEGFELLATGTSAQADRTLCLWRVPSVDALQGMLDDLAGGAARNDCFPVAEDSVYLAGAAQPAGASA